MVTYRHTILLNKIRNRIKPEDVQNAKMVLLFLSMFLVISFFAYRIVETVNGGLESQSKVENIAKQVERLEKENKFLKSERDAAISESEIEAQYRALGYKKPGEEVYIISKNLTPTPTSKVEIEAETTQKTPNWELWISLIFN